jgi:hypothetical protein
MSPSLRRAPVKDRPHVGVAELSRPVPRAFKKMPPVLEVPARVPWVALRRLVVFRLRQELAARSLAPQERWRAALAEPAALVVLRGQARSIAQGRVASAWMP